MVCSIWARRRSAAAISSAEGGSGSADSMRSISPSTSIHSRARSRATRSGSPMRGLVVERRQRLAELPAVDQRRLDAGDQLGPLVEDVVTDAGPRRGGLLDAAHRVVGLGVGLLGVAQGVAGVLELAAQRGLVELGRLEVAELAGRVVDHLPGGVALLLDEDELAPRRLDVGAAGVEGAPCLLGRVGELAGPFEEAVAVLEVGVHAPGPGGRLVSAVGGDGLQLAGPPQAGGQFAADALVVFDPADRGLAAGGFERRRAPSAMLGVVGASPWARATRRASRSVSSARSRRPAGSTVNRPCRPGSSPVVLMCVDVVSVVLDALTGGVLPSQQTASSSDPPGSGCHDSCVTSSLARSCTNARIERTRWRRAATLSRFSGSLTAHPRRRPPARGGPGTCAGCLRVRLASETIGSHVPLTVRCVETFVIRMWLPDRPGALGQVASRIGAVRGDVVGIDILERDGGQAVDELVVELPDDTLVDLLVAEVRQVDGVAVEEVRPVADALHDPRLDALEAAAQLVGANDVDSLLSSVVVHARRVVGAAWVAVVDIDGRGDGVLAADEGAPSAGWLEAYLAGSRAAEGSHRSPRRHRFRRGVGTAARVGPGAGARPGRHAVPRSGAPAGRRAGPGGRHPPPRAAPGPQPSSPSEPLTGSTHKIVGRRAACPLHALRLPMHRRPAPPGAGRNGGPEPATVDPAGSPCDSFVPCQALGRAGPAAGPLDGAEPALVAAVGVLRGGLRLAAQVELPERGQLVGR